MKTRPSFLITLIFALGGMLRLYSQGYLVPNGVTQVTYGDIYSFKVRQNPTNTEYTDFVFKPQSTTSFLYDHALDEGVRVFSVPLNAPVSLEAIQTLGYAEFQAGNVYTIGVGIPFYVGLYTSDQFPQNGVYANPLFGWAQLVNNGGLIELLDSAMVYNAAGIYAGTQTIIQPVPEPTALSLIFLGLGCSLCWAHRRRRNTPT